MNQRVLQFGVLCLLLITTVTAERWSRQVSQNVPISDDWIPVPQQIGHQPLVAAASTIEEVAIQQPNDRSGNARVLAYPHNVFAAAASNNVPSTFNFVHPYQFQRFQQQKGGPQPLQQQQLQQQSQQPTSQSFFKFEMPSFGADGSRDNSAPIQTGYQIHHTFGPVGNAGHAVLTQPLFSQQKPVFPPEFHPVAQQQTHLRPHHHSQLQQLAQHPQRKPNPQNYLEETKPAVAKDSKPAAQQNFASQENSNFHYQKPTSFQSQFESNHFRQQASPQQAQLQSAPIGKDEEVQLLYVPYDTLYSQRSPQEAQQQLEFNNPKYNLVQEPVDPLQINNFYTQDPLEPNHQHENEHEQQFNVYSTPSTTSTTSRSISSSYKPETNFQQFLSPKFTTSKPAKPKPKPHQPPLAMFYHKSSKRASTYDVVSTLSSERSVTVLDAPTKQAPEVFIGPAGLQTPSGYTKFELPYLSSFDHNNLDDTLNQTPFFVAPLSYKTPPGFTKLILPEPHVGSIVINRPIRNDELTRSTTRQPIRPTKESYITPFGNDIRFSNTTPRQTTTTRLQPSSTPVSRWQIANEQQNRITQAPRDYFRNQYNQEAIKEVSSPRTHQKPTTHHHKRPPPPTPTEPAFTQTVKPYAHFKPMPNNIANDDYFKKPSPSSARTTIQTTPSTTTGSVSSIASQSYFTEDFIASSPKAPAIDQSETEDNRPETQDYRPEITHRFQTKPLFDDEFRMKQYFRQQDAFKNRQPNTTPATVYENIQYTPVSLDYDHPSSTPNYYEGSTLRTTTPKERFTFYHPTGPSSTENIQSNTLPTIEQSNNYQYENQSPVPEVTAIPTPERLRPTQATRLPANHRPTYDNEVTAYNHDDKSQESAQYDPNPYDLPSELPPITPNLPGLVNALRENERLNAIEKETTEAVTTTEFSTSRPTRRPTSPRGRRPPVTRTSTSVSYSSSDDASTRRPINRVRRPYTTRNSTTASDNSTTRNPGTRNRSRYNPTPEERKQFRTRTRGQSPSTSSNNKNKEKKEEDNIDYQRDVLKQNYPVFKHPTRKPFFTTTPDKSSEDVVTVTPNTLKDSFPGLLEPMQIAQQYHEQVQQANYGPGYFPNEEEINPTEPSKNEISPIYTTPASISRSTTAEPIRETITKRPAFVRRPRPRTTTTETPTTTISDTNEDQQRYTVRPRTRHDGGNVPRKVIKIRARTRRPHPASSTIEPDTQQSQKKENNYQKVSRFNQDFYNDDYKKEANKRTQLRSKFNLETQESQWSPSLTRQDSFKPINPKENVKSVKFENEPDIVTVGPEGNQARAKPDTYEFNVSAGFGESMSTYGSVVDSKATESRNDRKTEPTFEELLEQVMADIGREASKKEEVTAKAEEDIEKKITTPTRKSKSSKKDEKIHRRGVWKKVRVQPADGFETAESQNIGTHLRNSIVQNEKENEEKNVQVTESLDNVDLSDSMTTSSSTTTEKAKPAPTTTLAPEIVPETELPVKFETKVETVTSISEEVSRAIVTRSPATTTTTQSSLLSQFEDVTTAVPIDSTTTRFYNHDYEHDDSIGDAITRRVDQFLPEEQIDDLETQPSLFDEVRSQLKDLFAAEEDDEDVEYSDVVKPNFQPRKHEYTSIQRIRAATATPDNPEDIKPELTTSDDTLFHKNLMKNVVYATSTSTTVDHETEICYRGRCVKAQKQT